MLNLGSAIAALTRHRGRIEDLAFASLSRRAIEEPKHLSELVDFGSNPGNLRAWTLLPEDLGPKAPLIVVLHGCGQSAAEYDRGAGWSALANEIGAAALFPEQRTANNSLMCFNWFSPRDTTRNSGEALSIRQMIESMAERHGLDRKRIFIAGLSAGAAMAGAMLALYPEVFAAGAMIAGLPFGAATNALEAIAIMSDGAERSPELTRAARAASAYRGPWPRVAVWQGSADQVVHPSNGDRIVEQWLHAHGVKTKPALRASPGYRQRTWCDRWGRALVEQVVIEEMGHGTPVGSRPAGAESSRFVVDVGVSSTRDIARFWGLLPGRGPSTRSLAQTFADPIIPMLHAAEKWLASRLHRFFPDDRACVFGASAVVVEMSRRLARF